MNSPSDIKGRLVNIYKGIIKYNKADFSRQEFIAYFSTNQHFISLFANWQSTKNSQDKPTVWFKGVPKELVTLSALLITTQMDRSVDRQSKVVESLMSRYGVTNSMHSLKCKEKLKKTNLERYGSENCFSNNEVKRRIKETNLKNLGVEYPTQSKDILEKRVKTYRERYGVDNPNKNKEVRKKSIDTSLKRYGVENPSKNKQVIGKIIKTKSERGIIKLINGRTLTDLSLAAGKSQGWACKVLKEYGEGAFFDWINFNIRPGKVRQNLLEKKAEKELNLKFFNIKVLTNSRSRPDFKLSDNIFLDVDGLFWHSDAVRVLTNFPGVSKVYHRNKRRVYEAEGKQLIQLRESEINEKLDIIRSMVHKVTQPEKFQKIFARNCSIATLSTEETHKFILENHLQGPGHRLKGTFLLHKGVPVMCMSYRKAINRVGDKETFEISRMCSKLYTVVVGGASRLLKKVEKELPRGSILKTAADLRYSNGNTYEKLGFEFYKEEISFGWTDLKTVYHRLKVHRDKDAAKKGFFKIWDAGQRYYIKHIK